MKTIFVIGNGFDLAHRLNTSYQHFIKSLSSNIPHNKLLNIIRISKLDCWSDIEYTYFKLLNSYDNKQFIINNLNYTETFRTSKELDNNFENIKLLLENYLQNEQQNLELMNGYSKLFSSFNDEHTLILDFNYTNTIYKYLNGIGSRIEHIKIHGELQSVDNPIIFGYAANVEEAKVLSNKNDEYLMKNIKKLRYLLTDNELTLKKHLNESQHSIDVYILGHSCGISDRLILHELFTHNKVNSITPFYFDEMNGFLKTVINIDRVIDDYSKIEKKEKSFAKLNNYKQSTAMLQHNSTNTDIDIFLKFVSLMKTKHDSKESSISKLSSIF